MVDLRKQYEEIEEEVNQAVIDVMKSTRFIGGPQVEQFAHDLAAYHDVKHVIPCANGTDALQIALMALDLPKGSEIILPSFTYVATAEVVALLGYTPILIDVDLGTFNLDIQLLEQALTPNTKAIVPVHLFGQSADMEPILAFAQKHGLYVIEDNAQAIGAEYVWSDGRKLKTGSMGHFGCTSFFPSKNLGCYGDGGAIMTNDDQLAAKARMIANHGQSKLYYHDVVGVNSRLDAMQAAILNIKLRHLDRYNASRLQAANYYDAAFQGLSALVTPKRSDRSSHVFHQYTLRLIDQDRDAFRSDLAEKGIPSMIYYPVPLYQQPAFLPLIGVQKAQPVTETLCKEVVSLPMHSEFDQDTLAFITETVKSALA